METTEKRSEAKTLLGLIDFYYAAVWVAGGLAITAGIIMVVVGKWTDGGGYFADPTVYELRPLGFVVAALGLLSLPLGTLAVQFAKAWAEAQD